MIGLVSHQLLMNHFLFLSLFLGSALLVSAQEKPATAPEKKPEAELSLNQRMFLNLPEERRSEFGKHLGEADRLFRDKRVFESIDEL